MFLTRITSLGLACVALVAFSGCLTHSRVLYQPKPFKRATVPASVTPEAVPATAPETAAPTGTDMPQ